MDTSDSEVVRQLEALTLPAAQFDHRTHVRVAWWYLRHDNRDAAVDRFRQSVKAFATSLGAAEKYHETITVAYMLLIADRSAQTPDLCWEEFFARWPELFAQTPPLLSIHYSRALLESSQARHTFVLPDLCPLPGAERVQAPAARCTTGA